MHSPKTRQRKSCSCSAADIRAAGMELALYSSVICSALRCGFDGTAVPVAASTPGVLSRFRLPRPWPPVGGVLPPTDEQIILTPTYRVSTVTTLQPARSRVGPRSHRGPSCAIQGPGLLADLSKGHEEMVRGDSCHR